MKRPSCFEHGTAFALLQAKDRFEKKSDKAKPRAIVGRKATGPLRTAGLPKQEEFCGPVVYTDTGPFFVVVWVI